MTKRALFSLVPVIALAGMVEIGFRVGFEPSSLLKTLAKTEDPDPSTEGAGYFWRHTDRVPRVRRRSSPSPPSLGQPGDTVIRVVAIGGSSAAGYPYDPRLSFPSVLRTMLEMQYPDHSFQVLNLARFALPYRTAANAFRDTLSLRPEFLLVYSGHNELYPHNLAQTIEWQRRSNWRRALDAMSHTMATRSRAFAWMIDRNPRPSYTVSEGFNSFEHLGDMLVNYTATTKKIIAQAESSETTVLMGTLLRNLRDFPPDEYQTTLSEAFPPLEPRAFSELPQRQRREPRNLYRLARSLDARGETVSARQAYVEASDSVTRLTRVHSTVQDWIERVQDFHPSVVLVETEREAERSMAAPILGDETLFDWVHPRLESSYLIAKSYWNAMRPRLDELIGAPSRGIPTLDEIRPRLAENAETLEADGLVEAGFVNLQVGRPDVALHCWEQALSASPTPAMVVKAILGRALIQVRRGELEAARAAIDALEPDQRALAGSQITHYRGLAASDDLARLIE